MQDLAVVPIVLAFAATAVSGYKTVLAWLARRDLSRSVKNGNEEETARLRNLVAANDLDGAATIIRDHFRDLSQSERREADYALSQPSKTGRGRYIRAVAGIE